MNLAVRSPARPDDDLDGLLRAFFQAEMPHPWPALKAPPSSHTAPPAPPRRSLFRSRLALAASVALLVTGALALPGRFTGPTGGLGKLPPGEARRHPLPPPSGPEVHLHLQQKPDQPTEIRADAIEGLGGLPPSR
jgi:hypothetical protein